MYWQRDSRYRKGGFWRCRARKREAARRSYRDDPQVRLNQQLRNMSRIRVVN